MPTVPNSARDANAEIVKTLGLPCHKGSGRLAIVGGGNSINSHIEELRNWDGSVWAINGAVNWCLDHGIDAAFYTIDAQPPSNWGYALNRIKRAIVASDCSPALILKLLGQGAEVSLLPVPEGGPDIGPTSACYAGLLGPEAGYSDMTWFGCEGSFGETTHAFASPMIAEWICVSVGGAELTTKPEFAQQSQVISEIIRAFPKFYSERSGGLLRAMIEHGSDYDVSMVSNELFAKLTTKEAA